MSQSRRGRLRRDTVVVRFGVMELPHLRRSVRDCRLIRGFFGLSFYGENGLGRDDVALAAQMPHRWMRVTSYGRMRDAGYPLRRHGGRNHLSLRFEEEPSDDELNRLIALFDDPVENPHAFPQGGSPGRDEDVR